MATEVPQCGPEYRSAWGLTLFPQLEAMLKTLASVVFRFVSSSHSPPTPLFITWYVYFSYSDFVP